jgi:signal transduction histidine kinase/HAMP domain-containing protein
MSERPRYRLTFRAKLLAIVGVAAVAFLLLIVASGILANRVQRQLGAIQGRYLPKVELQPRLEGSVERLRRGFQDAVAAHDAEGLAATRNLKRQLSDELAAGDGALDRSEVERVRSALEDYDTAAYDVSRRLIADETGEALVDAMSAMQAKQVRLTEALRVATTFDQRELSDAFAAVARSEAAATRYRLWISVGCLVTVVALSLALSQSVLGSLGELASGLRRFATGEFGQRIDVHTQDELGDVAAQANQMAASLDASLRERRKAEERFRALLETAPDSIVIANDAGGVVFVNAQTERLFGYSRNELLEQKVEELLPPPGPSPERVGRRKDGTEFPVEISSNPLATDEGLLVTSAIRDISARKRMENELKNSNRELEAFSYSVAHDLRAPLRGINGFAGALMMDAADKLDEEGRDYLRRIAAAAERMGNLIDALLALARVTRAEVRREAVNLSRLAEAVIGQLRASQPERVVEFVTQDDIVAEGDTVLLRALLENLLGNAWKYSSGRDVARIQLRARLKNGVTVYSVEDNGAGFDMAYKDKLFAPFQRLHKASEFAGTGVGLATVQRIVGRHGGQIWAEAEVDRGATFYFTLEAGGMPS